MTSPVGHGIAGIAGSLLLPAASARARFGLLVLFVVSANAADFDFIPGLLINDFNVFHRGPTHSISFAFIWAALVWVIARRFSPRPLLLASLAGAFYGSHLLLDYFGSDTRAPFGIPLFWPFVEGHFIHDTPFFGGIKHGVPGDSLPTVMSEVFSVHNFKAMGREFLATVPLVIICWLVGKLFRAKR